MHACIRTYIEFIGPQTHALGYMHAYNHINEYVMNTYICMHSCATSDVLYPDDTHAHTHTACMYVQYMECITSYDDETVEALPTRIKAAMMRSGQW
jgi:hypothetical protein